MNLSGWHDETYGPEGAITNFQGLLEARRKDSDPRTRLILGPWTHGGEDSDRAGDRVFGAQAKLPYANEILRFMDRYVRGIANGIDSEPRVRAFVMGEDVWRAGDTLPLPGTRSLSLYLAAGGRLERAEPAAAGSSAFVSDPDRPVVDPHGTEPGAHDQRALARRGDVVVFETEPLAEALRVIGAVETEIYVSADAPDADVWIHLEDVAEDGTAWNLSSPGTNVQRISERGGAGEPRLLAPGETALVRHPNLRTGNRFARGHRIRVVLSGSFMPHFSRNLQTGESEARSSRSRKATIHIHHEPGHASRILLPVVPDADPR